MLNIESKKDTLSHRVGVMFVNQLMIDDDFRYISIKNGCDHGICV